MFDFSFIPCIRRFGKTVPLTAVIVAMLSGSVAEAQLGRRIRDAARRATEREASRQVDRAITNAIRCAVGEYECYRRAKDEGQDVVFVDPDGNIITDDEGNPVMDYESLPDRYRGNPSGPAADGGDGGGAWSSPSADAGLPAVVPGEGVWANYDFIPGDRLLFAEDFTSDRVGDFPRRLEFVRGTLEVVDWAGQRFLRATGGVFNHFRIQLSEPLPERFTIEFDLHLGYAGIGHFDAAVITEPFDGRTANYADSFILLGGRVGLAGRDAPASTMDTPRLGEELVPVRIMADGSHVKMFLDEQRVANVPNARLNRSDTLEFRLRGSEDRPSFITNIRVAAGGRDLYQALSEDGRAITRGIYFDTGSAEVRPESTGTLDEIARTLRENSDLRIRIEGHTDSVGGADSNQSLSERRAESVLRILADVYGISESRLEAAGFGQERPIGENDTPEGRQKNRRVELVRLD
jgi:OmpA-OmpF porin, OOP family